MNTKEIRRTAIATLHETFENLTITNRSVHPQTVATLVKESLMGLSRTPRWDEAVQNWAKFIENAPEGHWEWAYNQGCVRFGYDVEGLI